MIKLQVEDFDVSAELRVMLSGHKEVGGVCTFVGLVRALLDPWCYFCPALWIFILIILVSLRPSQ